MEKIHFIAIGGSAMHNLAIALHKKGYIVSGSDDEIFEPSKSRLEKYNLLPKQPGWNPEIISTEIDAIILGMHAREDNPELLKAKELGLRIYSYPEFLYEQCKEKKRVVIGGSHGKTTITSMIMHVLLHAKNNFDYMVGAQLKGFETMVKLTKEAPISVFEGDEYLSSPIDKRPKFHLYYPNIALISGVAWDHINVFPSFDIYKEQFAIFIDKIQKDGTLIYCDEDPVLKEIAEKHPTSCKKIPYTTHKHTIENNTTYLVYNDQKIPIQVFGNHNLQNISGAFYVCKELGINEQTFYEAISSFSGASKRLQLLAKNENTSVFLDFAHSPSKLKATTSAVKEQFKNRKLVACMELHTFSSLNADFLDEYKDSMNKADTAIVYFNPAVIKHKRLKEIKISDVQSAFGRTDLKVYTNAEELLRFLKEQDFRNKNLLLMTSGNFSGIDYKKFSENLVK
ncbi:MAG: peptidoglycan synthetase [Marinilabiliales bacterium]|mgnify:CR=1 FL=1|nr:MAG: peptidoglycan synthetase [Marinilabiliales bacterium]